MMIQLISLSVLLVMALLHTNWTFWLYRTTIYQIGPEANIFCGSDLLALQGIIPDLLCLMVLWPDNSLIHS